MRASSPNLRLAPESPARKASLLVLMHVYNLYIFIHAYAIASQTSKTENHIEQTLISQKGCILKLQLSDLKQL